MFARNPNFLVETEWPEIAEFIFKSLLAEPQIDSHLLTGHAKEVLT